MSEYAAEHTVSITAYFERERDDFQLKAPTTYAILEVRPPIDYGDESMMRHILLGREWCLVDIRKLFANAKAAVFMAESSLPEQAERHEDIEEIARRLGHLANNPTAALTMMEDRVFPEKKHEPQPEAVPEAVIDQRPEEESVADSVPEDEQAAGVTVRLEPVEVPPLAVNLPPMADMEDGNSQVIDFPQIGDTPKPEEPEVPSAFGPIAAKLTGLTSKAPTLPWPSSTSEGRHAFKGQNDN